MEERKKVENHLLFCEFGGISNRVRDLPQEVNRGMFETVCLGQLECHSIYNFEIIKSLKRDN